MRERVLAGTHILVPLDGSDLAERALPAAERIASALRATLVLARIAPPARRAPSPSDEAPSAQTATLAPDDELRMARTYLDGVALPLRVRGLRVQVIAQQGVAGPALIDLLSALQIGLVVMTTRGRSGMARFALGSVADVLVRSSHTPVLLLRPMTERPRAERLDHAVIPLDGSERAEAELDLAAALSGSLIHEITLLRIVSKRDSVASGHATEDAMRYLRAVSERLTDEVARRVVVRTQVEVGDPAEHIVRRAKRDCDVLIMSTRGEVGTRRWLFGSVADRVLHDSGTPLILVAPPGEERSALQPVAALNARPGAQSWGAVAMNPEDENERDLQRPASTSGEQAAEAGAPGGGAGRTETPGHTGVYPLSASEGASGEAQVRSEPAWGQGERGAKGYEDFGDSSLEASMGRGEREVQPDQSGVTPPPDDGSGGERAQYGAP